MKIIEPKISEIINEMRIEGCAYVGGGKCCCHDAIFFESCYKKKKEFIIKNVEKKLKILE